MPTDPIREKTYTSQAGFSRYVLRVNLGGIEELPVFFMCICIWMGAIRVMRDDKMVKIEIIFSLVKNERAQAAINMVASLLSCAVLAFFCTRHQGAGEVFHSCVHALVQLFQEFHKYSPHYRIRIE